MTRIQSSKPYLSVFNSFLAGIRGDWGNIGKERRERGKGEEKGEERELENRGKGEKRERGERRKGKRGNWRISRGGREERGDARGIAFI